MKPDDRSSLGEALKKFAAVVVTGGSSGIGKSFIKLVSKVHPGILICNLSRREPLMNSVELKLRHVPCDFSRSDQILRGVEEVLSILNREAPEGRVLLINNSGYGSHGPFLEADLANELGILEVNVRAVVEITGRFLSTLKARGGAIINLASTAAFQPTPWMATYGASKAFILDWSLALHEELKPLGIPVLAVCPGPTSTGFAARAGVKPGTVPGLGGSSDEVARTALKAMAARRAYVVCGWRNRLLVFGVGFLPRTWAARVARFFISRVQHEDRGGASL